MDVATLIQTAALTDEDSNLVGPGGMAHPSEVAPRSLAALIRIEAAILAQTEAMRALTAEIGKRSPKGG